MARALTPNNRVNLRQRSLSGVCDPLDLPPDRFCGSSAERQQLCEVNAGACEMIGPFIG